MNFKRKIFSGVVLVMLSIAASNVFATTEQTKEPYDGPRPQIQCVHDLSELCGLVLNDEGHAECAWGFRCGN